MQCATCRRRIGPGSKRCMYCGAAVTTVEPAAGPAGAPPRTHVPPRRRTLGYLRSGGATGATVAGILALIIVGAMIGLRTWRSGDREGPEAGGPETVTIPAGQFFSETRHVTGPRTYLLEVTALDGPCRAGIVKVDSPKGITEARFPEFSARAVEVGEGATHALAGTLDPGYHTYVVWNAQKQPVRVRVSFRFP